MNYYSQICELPSALTYLYGACPETALVHDYTDRAFAYTPLGAC
jgi:hypothetical protein